MNRLRAIAIEEQRQLLTFAFALAVFMLTLLALQLHGRSPTLNRVGNANRHGTSRASHENGGTISGNRRVALVAASSIVKDSGGPD